MSLSQILHRQLRWVGIHSSTAWPGASWGSGGSWWEKCMKCYRLHSWVFSKRCVRRKIFKLYTYIYIYSYKMQIEVKPLPNSQDLIRIYSIYIKVYASCQRSCQQGFNIPPGIHMLGPKILVHDRFLPIRLVIQHPDVSNLRPQKQTVKKPWDFLVCIGGKNTKNKDEKQTHDTKVYGKKTFLPRNIK